MYSCGVNTDFHLFSLIVSHLILLAVDFISSMKVEKDELTKEIDSLREEVARLKNH